MRIDFDPPKEAENKLKHGFDFSLSPILFSDPLGMELYDRFENGEHRWHWFAYAGDNLLVVVYTYPDQDVEDWFRVIGLRTATRSEMKRYEEGGFL